MKQLFVGLRRFSACREASSQSVYFNAATHQPHLHQADAFFHLRSVTPKILNRNKHRKGNRTIKSLYGWTMFSLLLPTLGPPRPPSALPLPVDLLTNTPGYVTVRRRMATANTHTHIHTLSELFLWTFQVAPHNGVVVKRRTQTSFAHLT